MGHLVEIDRADEVDRADQFLLDVPGEVAGVEKLEPAEREQDRQAAGIIRSIDGLISGAVSHRGLAASIAAASRNRLATSRSATSPPEARTSAFIPLKGSESPAFRPFRLPALAFR